MTQELEKESVAQFRRFRDSINTRYVLQIEIDGVVLGHVAGGSFARHPSIDHPHELDGHAMALEEPGHGPYRCPNDVHDVLCKSF